MITDMIRVICVVSHERLKRRFSTSKHRYKERNKYEQHGEFRSMYNKVPLWLGKLRPRDHELEIYLVGSV